MKTMPSGTSRKGSSAPRNPMDICKRWRQKMKTTFQNHQALGTTVKGKTMKRSTATGKMVDKTKQGISGRRDEKKSARHGGDARHIGPKIGMLIHRTLPVEVARSE